MNGLVIAAIVVVVLLLAYHVWRAHIQPKQPSLYDRLGGIFAIAAVVNDFSDRLIDNPIVGKNSPNAFLADWHKNKLDRLPGLKWLRTLWLASLAGGPYKYHGTKPGKCPFSLENAHMGLQISPEEFDAVAVELSKSLDKFKVPPQEKSEVLAAFSAHKSEITMGYNTAKGIANQPLVC